MQSEINHNNINTSDVINIRKTCLHILTRQLSTLSNTSYVKVNTLSANKQPRNKALYAGLLGEVRVSGLWLKHLSCDATLHIFRRFSC